MASATLNLRVSPRRMLSLKEAADYCGLSAKKFPTECGISPVEFPSGSKLYDIQDLDAFLDGLKRGPSMTDDDEIIGKLGAR